MITERIELIHCGNTTIIHIDDGITSIRCNKCHTELYNKKQHELNKRLVAVYKELKAIAEEL